MAKRKKPEGQEWVYFVETWRTANHEEKVQLCKQYGTSYDGGKHWFSEGDTSPAKEETANPESVVSEILALTSRTKLDFVTYDVETTGLKADFSVVLSAVIKPYLRPPIVFRADSYLDWQEGRRAVDNEICRDITMELSRHAVVITHYGTGYDLPYTRAKLIRYGLPPLPPMFAFDTYSVAKRNMLVSRRRLETLAEYLQLGVKSSVQGNLWMEAAMNGDAKAMDAIVAHNIQDCILLEKLACLLFPYLRSIRRL